jgi:hypothetical protein
LPFADLLRQLVCARLAGDTDVNDAEWLCHDPTFRLAGSKKIWDREAAMASRLQTFDTEMLAEGENLIGLTRLNRALLGRVEVMDSIIGPCWTWIPQKSRCMGSQSRAPKRGISSPLAISPSAERGSSGLRITGASRLWLLWLSTTRGVRMESDQIRRDGHGPLDPPPGLRNRQAEGLL